MVEKVARWPVQNRTQVSAKARGTRLTREEQELRDRLSLALRHAMPEYAQQEAWIAYVARKTGVSAAKIERHLSGATSCKLIDFTRYADFFGPEFEKQVRGS